MNKTKQKCLRQISCLKPLYWGTERGDIWRNWSLCVGEGQYFTSETAANGNVESGLEGSVPGSWEDRDMMWKRGLRLNVGREKKKKQWYAENIVYQIE